MTNIRIVAKKKMKMMFLPSLIVLNVLLKYCIG